MSVAGGPREKGCGEDHLIQDDSHGQVCEQLRVVRRNEFFSDDPLFYLSCIPGLVLKSPCYLLLPQF